MEILTKIEIDGKEYILAAETVPDGSITNVKLLDGSVSTNKIANGAVTRDKLAKGAVYYDQLADNSVGAKHIVKESVFGHHIFRGQIDTSHLANGAVTRDKLGEDVLTEINTMGENAAHALEIAESASNVADDVDVLLQNVQAIGNNTEEAKRSAETAISIAKGANQSKTFDTEAELLSWIESRKMDNLDTATGSWIDGSDSTNVYCVICAVDAEPLKCWYNEDESDSWYSSPDTAIGFIEFEDGYTQDFSNQYVYERFGRYYTCVMVEHDGTWRKIKSIDVQFTYNSANCTSVSKNPTYRLVNGEMNDIGFVFNNWGEVTGFTAEDAKISELVCMYDIAIGQNLYIRDTDVPDYWWDGTKVQPLETQKVDLTEYMKSKDANKSFVPAYAGSKINRVYVFDEKGQNSVKGYDSNPTGWTFPIRDGNGCLKSNTPSEPTHVVNKAYVENLAKKKSEVLVAEGIGQVSLNNTEAWKGGYVSNIASNAARYWSKNISGIWAQGKGYRLKMTATYLNTLAVYIKNSQIKINGTVSDGYGYVDLPKNHSYDLSGGVYLEIALNSNSSPRTDLDTLTAECVNSSDYVCTLTNLYEYYVNDVAKNITINTPTVNGVFNSYLYALFTESANIVSSAIKWYGDNVLNEVFTPLANTRYKIHFSYDGLNIIAKVESLYLVN